jgi:hypothetical protein
MVRIIYYTPDLGYRIKDRSTHEDILDLETSLKNTEAEVICIVDFKNKLVSNKSSDFQEHLDRMDEILFEESYVQL